MAGTVVSSPRLTGPAGKLDGLGISAPLDQSHSIRSELFDISAAASEQVLLRAELGIQIFDAYILWNEATGASGALEGDITIGTVTGGAEIVAATPYAVSQATGAKQQLVLVNGVLNQGQVVFASHDQASGAAGSFYLVLWYVGG